ncbi:MAG TPA: TetR/AcrR family transcriptional regulator [Puia sp.]|nr:TetR/AcrR family transcriptional regulator [Puia sp.]
MPKEVLFDEEDVLRRGTELFWTKGYNGTSMDELTRATGLSRSSIYNSFGGKHELFMRCLRYYLNDQEGQLRGLADKIRHVDQRIRAAFQYAVEDIVTDRMRKGCMMVNTTTEMVNQDKEIAAVAAENMENMERIFTDWIKEGQAAGDIHTKLAPQALAKHLFNTYSGLKVYGKTRPDRKTLEDIITVALSVLEGQGA